MANSDYKKLGIGTLHEVLSRVPIKHNAEPENKEKETRIKDKKIYGTCYYAVDENGSAYLYKNCPEWYDKEGFWHSERHGLKIGENHKFTYEPIEVMIVPKNYFNGCKQKKSKKPNKIQKSDDIVLYIYANEYDWNEQLFSGYSLFNDKNNILSVAENDSSGYQFSSAIFLCKIPYSNGVFYSKGEDPIFILDEDFDMSELEETVYNLNSGKEIDSIYVLEQYGGEQSWISDLIISLDISNMLKILVDKAIEKLEESEEDVISEANEWLQMQLKLKTIDEYDEDIIISLKMFDGKTLTASIHNDDIAKELEEICKSKNIELVIN